MFGDTFLVCDGGDDNQRSNRRVSISWRRKRRVQEIQNSKEDGIYNWHLYIHVPAGIANDNEGQFVV